MGFKMLLYFRRGTAFHLMSSVHGSVSVTEYLSLLGVWW